MPKIARKRRVRDRSPCNSEPPPRWGWERVKRGEGQGEPSRTSGPSAVEAMPMPSFWHTCVALPNLLSTVQLRATCSEPLPRLADQFVAQTPRRPASQVAYCQHAQRGLCVFLPTLDTRHSTLAPSARPHTFRRRCGPHGHSSFRNARLLSRRAAFHRFFCSIHLAMQSP